MAELPPFQTLIDEHAAAVLAVLRGAVGREGAEDAFQETFLAALRAYPGLRDARNLRGWLVTIAHRKAIDHHRARGRAPVPVADVREEAFTDPDPADGAIWNAVAVASTGTVASPVTSPSPRSSASARATSSRISSAVIADIR